jgi:hypothetical protein
MSELQYCRLCEKEVLIDEGFQTVFQTAHRRIVTEGKGGRAHILLLGNAKAEALNTPEEKVLLVYKDPPVTEPLPEGDWFDELMSEEGVV